MWSTRREERRRTREALVAALAALASTQALSAQPVQSTVDPAALPETGLLVRSSDATSPWSMLPQLSTRVAVSIDGLIARTGVDQRFTNPGTDRVDAVYLFPLPEGAAVDGFELQVGGRRIFGDVRERAQAKRTYETARREGRKASLLEQRRPNLFTLSVAGIAGGETVSIHLDYQKLVRYDLGGFHLRIPLVVGPRYESVPRTASTTIAGGDSPAPAVFAAPASSIVERPLTLTIALRPGFPLAAISSPTHSVRVLPGNDPDSWRIGLAAGAVPTDRDFELVWKPRSGSEPRLVRFDERVESVRFAGILFVPPTAEPDVQQLPRELVIVLDTSGSMGGTSIEQAKQAVRAALARLRPDDRFNLVRFSDDAEPLFPSSVNAGARALATAEEFVEGLEAEGGTNMRAALESVLADRGDPAVVRQILFVTDGCVGNEQELFRLLAERLGDNRLFTVGIGSAPNSFFMTGAARQGRGTYTFIGQISEVEQKMGELFRKLEAPVLSDIEVIWDDPAAESYPERVPDLYLGEPLLVLARLSGDDAGVRISGRLGDRRLDVELPEERSLPASDLDRLWARRKIESLEAARRNPGADAEDLRAEIVRVALAAGVVSRFTSFVAVEQMPSLPPGEAPAPRQVPTLMPAGWSGGELPQGGTAAPLLRWLALVAALSGVALRVTLRLGA